MISDQWFFSMTGFVAAYSSYSGKKESSKIVLMFGWMKFEKNITSLLYILVGISSLWDALCASSFPVSFLIYFVFKNAIKKCYVQFAWKCRFFPKQFRVLCCQEKLQISTTILHRNMEMLQLKIFENMKK